MKQLILMIMLEIMIIMSFKNKTKLKEVKAAANGIVENVTIAVPLKYLIIFWRLLQIPLINGKIKLKLKATTYFEFKILTNI